MCGLAGILRPDGEPVRPEEAAKMIDAIRHRGPDDDGVWAEGPVALGHLRLSILDLSPNAAQPMHSHDGRFVLAYNGEIFNFPSLRMQLERCGVPLRSTGDTEVLLEHLARRGVEPTLADLEGDFAFALWDRRDRVLSLARDRHGVKPLYYTQAGGREVRFASEIKALLEGGLYPDVTGLSATLLGFSGTWGDRTLFREVRSVCPGEWLEFRGSTTPRRWRLFTVAGFVDEGLYHELSLADPREVIERVEAELEASTRLRMVSDAPVACLVSGGVDSSLVTVMSRRHHGEIALYLADVLADSERPAAEMVAALVNGRLRTTVASDEMILDSLAEVTWFNEVPLIYHLNSVPFYLVSKLAGADGVKVLLTGEGSDEYFLGYPQCAISGLLGVVNATKAGFQHAAHRLAPRAATQLWPKRSEDFAELLQGLVSRHEETVIGEAGDEAFAFLPPRQRRLHVRALSLVQSHLVSLLHRNDRLGMAWGLESRFPFLGHDLARLAVNLPGRYKLRFGARLHDRRHPFIVDKWAVRAVADRQLPKALAWRSKQGFPVSVYRRLEIRPAAFEDGFVAEEYRLDSRALAALFESATPLWRMRLLLLEVWGQLFVHRRSVDATQALVAKAAHARG